MKKDVKSGVILAARSQLKMTQPEFSVWLGEKLGKDAMAVSRVSEWERGVRSPRRNVRDACAPVAALGVAKRIEAERPSTSVAAQWIADAMA